MIWLRSCNFNFLRTETVMITLKKIKQQFSQFLSRLYMKMDRGEKEKRGPKKSFLAVKLDVHMTNFKGCQKKKKKMERGSRKKGWKKIHLHHKCTGSLSIGLFKTLSGF